jgi:UDP-glucuronate 4-epimerase
MNRYKIFVSGGAGFIGSLVLYKLFDGAQNHLEALDNFSSYYDSVLKAKRFDFFLEDQKKVVFYKKNINDMHLGDLKDIDVFIHLAAQPGVRESLRDPMAYEENNIKAFVNVLEYCRHNKVKHLIYASSSSVYGQSTRLPFSEDDPCDRPASFYGATKKANELMAHSYASCFGLPCTGLRFFTVYGPWGRPDMAYFSFAKAIMEDKTITLHGGGQFSRDFTYIDDIVEGIIAVMNGGPPKPDSLGVPHRIYNLGNDHPEKVLTLVSYLEESLGKKAIIETSNLPLGDVPHTWANIDRMKKDFGWSPKVGLREGIDRFAKWFLDYHGYKKCGI